MALLSATLVFGHSASAKASSCSEKVNSSMHVKYSSHVTTTSVTICADWLKVKSSKPKPVAKSLVAVGKPSKSDVLRRANRFTTRPVRPSITYRADAAHSQTLFTANATRHSKYGYLFSRRVQLVFTPKNYVWHFSDQTSSVLRSPTKAISKGEVFTAKLRVGYAVAFRAVGGGQLHKLTGYVYRTAWPVKLSAAAARHLRYVAFDCTHWAGAPGC